MNRYDVISSPREYDLTTFGIENFNFVTPNIVDSLCVETVTDSDGEVSSFSLGSDVNLLFNQQRLEKVLGRDGLSKFFDSLASRSSSFSSLRSKCSDDDLARLCKSRYLQSPSEILAWSNFLNDNYSALVDEVKSRSLAPDSPASASDSPALASDSSVPASASV